MAVRFRLIGKDPNSKNSDSPTAWLDTVDLSVVMQGYRVEDEAEVGELIAASDHHHGLSVPANETLIRWPERMMPVLKEIVDAYYAARPR